VFGVEAEDAAGEDVEAAEVASSQPSRFICVSAAWTERRSNMVAFLCVFPGGTVWR
jgi:hypothetical protein